MSLKLAILGLLSETPQTGYELHKTFDGSIGHFWEAKFQQVYGELRRLEREGLVERQEISQAGKPTRKVYAITPRGERVLDGWLDSASPHVPVRSEFLVKVFSIARLPRERALARLREHRRLHEDRLATYREIEARLAESGVRADSIPSALLGRYLTLQAGIAYEASMLEWCDRAVAAVERAEDSARPPATAPARKDTVARKRRPRSAPGARRKR